MPESVLVVVTQRIGDVFLTGALVRSLRGAWPDARIDMLVFAGTEGIVATHPDVTSVLTVPVKASFWDNIKFGRQLWKRYDLALSTSPGDRSTLYAILAGRRSIGAIGHGAKHTWKSMLLSDTVPFDNLSMHTVVQNLSLAGAVGVPRAYELPVTWHEQDEHLLTAHFPGFKSVRYAVLHPFPKFRYKMWSTHGWRETAQWLLERDITVVLSGGPDTEERTYVGNLLPESGHRIVNLTGKLNFTQLAALLSRAVVYVGPDTVTTHLAAAVGVPTVALFGPSNPIKWGPWPKGCDLDPSPFRSRGDQWVGNVALVQGRGACVPCRLEGCARHAGSESACLQMLPAATVVDTVAHMLGLPDRLASPFPKP